MARTSTASSGTVAPCPSRSFDRMRLIPTAGPAPGASSRRGERSRREPTAPLAEVRSDSRLAARVRAPDAGARRRGGALCLGAPRSAEPGVRDDRRRPCPVRPLHGVRGAARLSAVRHLEAPDRRAERDGRCRLGGRRRTTDRDGCARNRRGRHLCGGTRARDGLRLPRARPAANGLDLDVPLESRYVGLHPRVRNRDRDQPAPLPARRPRGRRLICAAALGNRRGDPGDERLDARCRCSVARAAAGDALRLSEAAAGVDRGRAFDHRSRDARPRGPRCRDHRRRPDRPVRDRAAGDRAGATSGSC